MGEYAAKCDQIEKEISGEIETECRNALEAAWRRLSEIARENAAKGFHEQSDPDTQRHRLDADAEKTREGWNRHFEAEQDDWQKDLELALLRVRITQAHSESEQSIQAEQIEIRRHFYLNSS